MRRRGDLAQRIDHGRKGHISQGCPKALKRIGKRDLQAGSEYFPVRFNRMPAGRNSLIAPKGDRDAYSTHGKSNGTGSSCTDDAHSCAGDNDLQPDHRYAPGWIDQKEIERNIDSIHKNTNQHWRSRITRRPEDRSENDRCGAKQHRCVKNEEISGGQFPNSKIYLHPYRHIPAQTKGQRSKEGTAYKHRKDRLSGSLSGLLRITGATGLGNIGKKTDTQR